MNHSQKIYELQDIYENREIQSLFCYCKSIKNLKAAVYYCKWELLNFAITPNYILNTNKII